MDIFILSISMGTLIVLFVSYVINKSETKEMEKQQQDEFAIGFAEWCLRIRFEPIENVSVKKLLEIYKKEKGL